MWDSNKGTRIILKGTILVSGLNYCLVWSFQVLRLQLQLHYNYLRSGLGLLLTELSLMLKLGANILTTTPSLKKMVLIIFESWVLSPINLVLLGWIIVITWTTATYLKEFSGIWWTKWIIVLKKHCEILQ